MRLGESPLPIPVPRSLRATPPLPRPHPQCPPAEFHNNPLPEKPPSLQQLKARRESCCLLSAKFPLPRAGETSRGAASGGPATLAASTARAFQHTRDSDPTPLAARPPCSSGTSPGTVDAGPAHQILPTLLVWKQARPAPARPSASAAASRLAGLPAAPAGPCQRATWPFPGRAGRRSPTRLLVPALPRASPRWPLLPGPASSADFPITRQDLNNAFSGSPNFERQWRKRCWFGALSLSGHNSV